MIDLKKLQEGLEKLTGLDLEQVAREERTVGNNVPLLDMEKSFQARLAAKALGMNPHEFKALPLKEYNAACQKVFTFLMPSDSAQEASTE